MEDKKRNKLKVILGILLILIIFIITSREIFIYIEFNEIKKGETSIAYSTPHLYSQSAIVKFVKWKYGNECKLSQKEKFNEGKIVRYTFTRPSRNDSFFIHSYAQNGTMVLNGGLVADETQWYKSVGDDYYIDNILICHLEEIKKLADEMGIRLSSSIAGEMANLIISFNDKDEIDNISNFLVELDKILNYSIREGIPSKACEIEIKYRGKLYNAFSENQIKIFIPLNENDRMKLNKEYYIRELNKLV